MRTLQTTVELEKIEQQLAVLRIDWKNTTSTTMKGYYENRAKMLKEKRSRLLEL